MQVLIGTTRVTLVQGDITKQSVDAIVNAANSSLLGGGGVDGAIHRAGGPAILEGCREVRAAQGECQPGQAVSTTAGELDAKRVIHTVGPIWRGGHKGEFVTLESAWAKSLAVAAQEGLRTVAFPSISTGAYGFPIDRAAFVALQTVQRSVRKMPEAFDEVRVVLFSEADFATYSTALTDVRDTMMG
jgi:O-acetyl-ADP-ribose deacetylase